MNVDLSRAPVLVVGAGIMGAGIAQVAAQAGHDVLLFDLREGAAAGAKAKLAATLDTLVSKDKLNRTDASATLARIVPITRLNDAASALLAIEAIVENLDAGAILDFQILADNTITDQHVQPDARRIRGLLKSPHAVPLTVEQMDEAVSKHLREKHAPSQAGRRSAGR